jgi:hypothetical protein
LTDEVFARHLRGEQAAGIYPLLRGDTCALLACDFDGSSWALAFKGRVVQYVGRLLRSHEGKHHVELHDYVDSSIPVLDRMDAKRHPAYTSLGFDVAEATKRRLRVGVAGDHELHAER